MEPNANTAEILLTGLDELFIPFALPGTYGRVEVEISLDRAKVMQAVLTHTKHSQTQGPKYAPVTKPLTADSERLKTLRQRLRDHAGALSVRIVPFTLIKGHFQDGYLKLVEVSSAEVSTMGGIEGVAKVFGS